MPSMPDDQTQTTAEQLALERDARRWRQIDYVIGSVITIRDTRISNNALPAAQLGRLLDEDANRD